MEKNKLFLAPEDVTEWLASTGYLFPRNDLELSRYNKLFGDKDDIRLSDSSVSIERIFSGEVRSFPEIRYLESDRKQITTEYKMVARNGLEELPEHIMRKMLNNQSKNDPSKKEEDR